ncbi:MAG: hypothetical protein AMXMBFR23_13770 [Chloroflexota bacterium]
MDMISLMIHVTAAAVLVGPQVLMFYAVVPSTWLIDGERLKRDILGVVARRFGLLSMVSIVVLLATGLNQFYTVTPQHIQDDIMGYRYGQIFTTKMTLFTVLLALVFTHMFVFSKRIRVLSDAVLAGNTDAAGALHTARMKSLLFSLLILLTSLGVMWLGVTLGHHEYSYVSVG